MSLFSRAPARAAAAALALTIAAPLACANLGPHVWVDQYEDPMPPPESGAYVLASGDVIQVRVFLQEGMSARARVRSDGKISLPFLNDVQAAGYEPAVLAQQLAVRLKDFVNNPVVTISVEEPRQLEVLVVGEVHKQGAVMLAPGAGVLQALVAAGGITEFGHGDRIFVVRHRPGDKSATVRVRFSYPSLLHGSGRGAAFRLRSGDHVVVD